MKNVRSGRTKKNTSKFISLIFGINPGETLILLGDAERGIAIPLKSSFAEYFNAAFHGKEN